MALPELLLIDKPKGISSFAVIRELRRRTGVKKFGHAGTLDPLATGLMLVGAGRGTKKLTALVGLDKEYVATICIGEERSTGDMEGTVVKERTYQGDLTDVVVKVALQEMTATLTLPVSAYSAIKKDGVPMYKRARQAAAKGEQIAIANRPVRRMVVYDAELQDFSPATNRLFLTVRFHVSSGTYIRSLAEELGRRLGYPATLASLRRTKIGSYSIKEASQLDDFGDGFRRDFRRRLSHLFHQLGRLISS